MGLKTFIRKMADKKDQVFCVAKFHTMGGYRIVTADKITKMHKVISEHPSKKEAQAAIKELTK